MCTVLITATDNAIIRRDMMNTQITYGGFSHDPLAWNDVPNLDYIPFDVRPQVNRRWLKVFSDIFLVVCKMLEDELVADNPQNAVAVAPTVSAVLDYISHGRDSSIVSRWEMDSAYFDRGGKIEYVLDCILHTARECGPRPEGDGTWDEERDEDEKWEALPKCKNDLAFYIARARLGLEGSMGPYFDESQYDGAELDAFTASLLTTFNRLRGRQAYQPEDAEGEDEDEDSDNEEDDEEEEDGEPGDEEDKGEDQPPTLKRARHE